MDAWEKSIIAVNFYGTISYRKSQAIIGKKKYIQFLNFLNKFATWSYENNGSHQDRYRIEYITNNHVIQYGHATISQNIMRSINSKISSFCYIIYRGTLQLLP